MYFPRLGKWMWLKLNVGLGFRRVDARLYPATTSVVQAECSLAALPFGRCAGVPAYHRKYVPVRKALFLLAFSRACGLIVSCLTHCVVSATVLFSASWPIRRSNIRSRYASDDGKNLHLALVPETPQVRFGLPSLSLYAKAGRYLRPRACVS